MKRGSFAIITAALSIVGCTEKNSVPASYNADLGQCHIYWTWKGWHGSLMISGGAFTVNGNHIADGTFVIDLHTLKAEDVDSAVNSNVVRQAIGPAGLNVLHFPTATLSLKPVNVSDERGSVADIVLNAVGNEQIISAPIDMRVNSQVAVADATFSVVPRGGKDTARLMIGLHLVANR